MSTKSALSLKTHYFSDCEAECTLVTILLANTNIADEGYNAELFSLHPLNTAILCWQSTTLSWLPYKEAPTHFTGSFSFAKHSVCNCGGPMLYICVRLWVILSFKLHAGGHSTRRISICFLIYVLWEQTVWQRSSIEMLQAHCVFFFQTPSVSPTAQFSPNSHCLCLKLYWLNPPTDWLKPSGIKMQWSLNSKYTVYWSSPQNVTSLCPHWTELEIPFTTWAKYRLQETLKLPETMKIVSISLFVIFVLKVTVQEYIYFLIYKNIEQYTIGPLAHNVCVKHHTKLS